MSFKRNQLSKIFFLNEYFYRYETLNGVIAEEYGQFENVGSRAEGVKSQGYFQFTTPEGPAFKIDYTAQAKGAFAYVPGQTTVKTPPTILKLLTFVENQLI